MNHRVLSDCRVVRIRLVFERNICRMEGFWDHQELNVCNCRYFHRPGAGSGGRSPESGVRSPESGVRSPESGVRPSDGSAAVAAATAADPLNPRNYRKFQSDGSAAVAAATAAGPSDTRVWTSHRRWVARRGPHIGVWASHRRWVARRWPHTGVWASHGGSDSGKSVPRPRSFRIVAVARN